jgi:streptogramin lyase
VVHVKGLSVIVRASLLLCASWGVLALTGCGMGSINHTAQVDVALNGKVHGGQQAVSGATVQLYMVGTGGNGSAASPMIPNGTYYLGGQPGCVASGSTTCYASVISDGNGNFSITGDYTCPTFGTQVYIVATGGNPGLASGTNNLALTMVEALGSCGNLAANTNTSLFIDEVTTAAAAWSLAPFATSATNIGSSATNATGIANAFLDEQLLADESDGGAATLPSNLTIETGKLYALADALSGCVNSDGTSGCSPLFSAATPSGGTAPADTFTAALNIVKNPGYNVVPVYQSIPTVPPFATTLTQAPNDWTMSLTVTGGGLFMPTAMAIDQVNNVWVTGQIGPLSEFSPQGTPLSATGYNVGTNDIQQAASMAVDSNGNLWITNYNYAGPQDDGAGSVSEFLGSSSGSPGSPVIGTEGYPTFYGPAISFPDAVSTNTNGQIFVANNATSSGTILNTSGQVTAGGLGSNDALYAEPQAIAADNAGGFWLSDDDDTIAHIDGSGNLLSHPNCCAQSYGLATDAQGNVWVASYLSNSFSEVSNGGSVLINQQAVGGLSRPALVAIDAAQNVWFTNLYANTISEIAGANAATPGAALSPTNGVYGTGGFGLDAGLRFPYSIVPDTAGNVWVSNQGKTALTMFFGLATPTVTPIQPVPTAP